MQKNYILGLSVTVARSQPLAPPVPASALAPPFLSHVQPRPSPPRRQHAPQLLGLVLLVRERQPRVQLCGRVHVPTVSLGADARRADADADARSSRRLERRVRVVRHPEPELRPERLQEASRVVQPSARAVLQRPLQHPLHTTDAERAVSPARLPENKRLRRVTAAHCFFVPVVGILLHTTPLHFSLRCPLLRLPRLDRRRLW